MSRVLVFAALALLLASCGGKSGGEQAFETWKAAWAAKDWGRVYDLIPPGDRQRRTEAWEFAKAALAAGRDTPATRLALADTQATPEELMEMDDRAAFARKVQELEKRDPALAVKMGAIQLLGSTTNGDQCTLRISNQGQETTILAVQVGGAWYIESPFEPR